MRELLKAIKAHLQADETLSYIRDSDISIASDENFFPPSGNFPAIVIRDGAIRNEQMLARNYLQYAEVRVSIFQRILKPEESLIGTHGVLEIAHDVIASLIDQRFDLVGVQNVFPISEDPSQFFGNKNEMIQKKTITFVFTIHKSW